MAPLARLIALTVTILELCLATALLLLFAYAHTNDHRTLLWRAGGIQGWNSDPSLRVYYYANYREPPPVPAIWDQRQGPDTSAYPARRITNSEDSTSTANAYIAVLTALLWCIRLKVNLSSSYDLDLCTGLSTNAIYDMLLVALWTTSIFMQRAGDFSDIQHLSVSPWYLERECEEAFRIADTACRVAKASYSLSVFAA
jgi:hypothetical protein